MLRLRATLSSLCLLVLFGVVGCGGPKYPKCDKDDQCKERGEICVEGTCQQCRTDANCPSGQRCAGGRCEVKPECTSERDCPGNQVCRSGRCQTECTSSGDCGSGLKCMNNRCVSQNACVSDADCSAGATCQNGLCSTENASRGLSLCDYPTVRFDYNEANLDPAAREGLKRVASCIKDNGGTLLIEGHADERGTEEYNLSLGERRAQAVLDYLAKLGVPKGRMQVLSKGELEPLDSSATESGWAKNRRAEFEAR